MHPRVTREVLDDASVGRVGFGGTLRARVCNKPPDDTPLPYSGTMLSVARFWESVQGLNTVPCIL